ncbi:MAG TPA: hypothetical protein DER60_11935 [Syntrophomonas sp.]|jgi:hypothetical protein|nr:hypothetical protein [Syntrophomonas sp.]
MDKVLLHTCCGPCATVPLPALRKEGFDVRGYFYNPNIHPFTEYAKRLEALQEYARQQGLKLIGEEPYNPVDYFHHITFREQKRCQLCYQIRLHKTAQMARSGKFDYFSTSLLVSPFQKHDLIKEAGEMAAEKYGVPFLYRDFRSDYKETVSRSKEAGLYRQQYCGCLYSEQERYASAKRKKEDPKS